MGETTGRTTQFPQKRKQGRGGNYRLKCSGWRCTFHSNSNKLTVKKEKSYETFREIWTKIKYLMTLRIIGNVCSMVMVLCQFFFLKSVSFKIPTKICTDEASDIFEQFRNKQWVEG